MVFRESKAFSQRLAKLLSDEDFRWLQVSLLLKPEQGKVIPGGGGLRKMRWALPGRGKSGGARVIYFWFATSGLLLLVCGAERDIPAGDLREERTGRPDAGAVETPAQNCGS